MLYYSGLVSIPCKIRVLPINRDFGVIAASVLVVFFCFALLYSLIHTIYIVLPIPRFYAILLISRRNMMFLYRIYRKLWYYENLEEGNANDLVVQSTQRNIVVIVGTFIIAVWTVGILHIIYT